MTVDEIRAGLGQCQGQPNGRPKAQRLESLAAAARDTGDGLLEGQVLLTLATAYEYSAERERLPVLLGRLLQLLDQSPAEVGQLSWRIHWQLKWMTSGLIRNPAVPLEAVSRWLDELGRRYRQRGYSLRPVHALRWGLAEQLGDDAGAAQAIQAAIAAPRDQMADCEACEHNEWGTWRARLGDDAGALEDWAPILNGAKKCTEEPHRALAQALLPLLRTGRADEARGAFLRGYPLARYNISLCASVGQHIEFCALTGNEARGLEILAEHATWLADTQLDATTRLSFATGVCVLLRRLTVLGLGALPVGPSTVEGTRSVLEQEIQDLCGRYDARNGGPAVSDRVARRLAAQPLLDGLPLGLPARLPQLAAAQVPAAPLPAAPASAAVPVASLGDLVAAARRRSEERHPHARQAWGAVAASGQDLPDDVAAAAARYLANAPEADPEAARQALLGVASQFARLGDLAGACEARASAAIAQARAGDEAGAAEGLALAIADADAAFGRGELAPREYLAVRRAGPIIAVTSLGGRSQRTPAELAGAAALVASELATAERLGVRRYEATFCDLLTQLSLWQGDREQARAHLARARELYLSVGEPWHAARLDGLRAQLALSEGDPQAAERSARDAVTHGGGLLAPEQAAPLSSLLADAIGEQPGRELDFVGASLTAAAQWEGISEPDTLHHTFNAARAYGRLGRHGEAAALFAEVMPRVHIPYEPTVIAMTREQYGYALRGIGRHREAAEQFLEAARLIQDDSGNVAAHAGLARAAADALQRSGQAAAALAAYQRAAELFREAGDVIERVRSLRSAAWLQFWQRAAAAAGPDAGQAGITSMRAVLSELESLAAGAQPEVQAAELATTRQQLEEMLTAPDPDDDDSWDEPDE